MSIRFFLLQTCLVFFLGRAVAVEVVTQKIDLLDVMKAGGVEYHVNPDKDFHDAPEDIWKLEGGFLDISGRGYGYMVTKESFRDYHLVVEFKWGAKTWGQREDRARDNGVLVHAHGPHGAYGNTWMASIEAQIIEGGIGDILVLSPTLEDGTKLETRLTAEIEPDRDGEKRWKKGAAKQEVTSGRINWAQRDEDWADKINFRGKYDPDSPVGEWNRLEVIAKGDTLRYFVNGRVVNEAFDASPQEGRICLQSEGAAMIVRRYELWPLGQFSEKWNPISASGGSNIEVRDGQGAALSPEESQRKIELDGDYEVQLVACEPLVRDPVECVWDDQGRMFVADMIDYPLGPPAGDPFLSRIQHLIDDDGDGRMDRAVTFADQMDHVQGLLPYEGGLIATTRTEILFLKDADGDGKAEVIRPLIKGLNPKHSQLQVSSPRWGPDDWVYFNNGLSAAEVYPAEGEGEAVALPRTNFKWNPRTGEIQPVSGYGQYGASFDDWGHHFFCSNRNPLMFAVMPHEAVLRNPYAGIDKGYEDVGPAGAETRVYPLQITHTTADAHAGTNTACSGLGVYRGPLMPDLKNNVFVPDPTGQLVTRYRIEPKGASLKATREGERTEFFRSGDEWCRPVNFTTGPDGAIYICDIYRRWIDHARFFPEEFVKSHDMRQGENEGRIWRVVPRDAAKLPVTEAAPKEAKDLMAWLDHENAWQRETARRLLLERGEKLPLKTVREEHRERVAFEAVLLKTDVDDQIDIQHLGIRLSAILAAPEDPWTASAVLASSTHTAGRVLERLLGESPFVSDYSRTRADTVFRLARSAAASGGGADFAAAVAAVGSGVLEWWKPALLRGIAEGLPKSKGKLGVKSLGDLIAKPPRGLESAAGEMKALMEEIDRVMSDPKAPKAQRLAVLPLLPQREWKEAVPILKQLFEETHTSGGPLREAALTVLKKYPSSTSEPLLYEMIQGTSPDLRREAVALLTANSKTVLGLFKKMEAGEISPALVDAETRWRHLRNTGEIGELAKKLFGQPSEDRAKVIADYMECTTGGGDADKGREVFAMVCVACHRMGEQGADVGPSLADVKVKPPEALLSDILDPNRMFEARWSAYQIDTKDGRVISGLLESESAETVTLKLMGGVTESVDRASINSLKSLDRTLMPVGLEAAISKEQMTNLLAFLLGR